MERKARLRASRKEKDWKFISLAGAASRLTAGGHPRGPPAPAAGIALAKLQSVKIIAIIAFVLFCAIPSQADDLAAQVQAELNLARTAPLHYAQIVAGHHRGAGERAVAEAVRFLEKARPLPPLTRSEGLSASALGHVLDLGPSGARGHTGRDGSTPWKRMARFGRWSGSVAENISYGESEARGIVVSLIIDDGVRGRGHRLNIFGRNLFRVGIACGAHAGYGTMCVMDFAGAFAEAEPRVAAIR